MAASVYDDCKMILFADDSAIFHATEILIFIALKLGSVLKKCSSWLVDNRLPLHLGKIEYILFSIKEKTLKCYIFKKFV